MNLNVSENLLICIFKIIVFLNLELKMKDNVVNLIVHYKTWNPKSLWMFFYIETKWCENNIHFVWTKLVWKLYLINNIILGENAYDLI